MKYKYTFLCPSYKSDFLEESLRSMLGQTLHNFKILLSDDCSPAPIYEVYKKIKKGLPPPDGGNCLSYRRNHVNFGGARLVDHWNLLLDLCDTDYLIIASDDDVYSKDFLREIDLLAGKYPQLDIFCSRAQRIDKLGIVTARDEPTDEFETQIDFLYGLYCLHRIKCIGNYVFKTSALRKMGGFLNFPYGWGSDDATVSMMCKKGIAITPGVHFSFRLSGRNISTQSDHSITTQKTKARIMNIVWFDDFKKSLTTDGSKLEENRLHEYLRFYLHEWLKSIKSQTEFLNFQDARRTFLWLCSRKGFAGTLEKWHFWVTWLKAHQYSTNG